MPAGVRILISMRPLRHLVPAPFDGLYHVISRVVQKQLIFGDAEKRRFRELMTAYAGFSGIDVVAWCLMDNHFHLLLRVPGKEREDPAALPEAEILRRLALIYRGQRLRHIHAILEACPDEAARREWLSQFTRRMGSLSFFMKALKQHFTQWYNAVNDRKGPLWEDRFKSFIVENSEDESLGHVARIVSAYIDLNPVRAGLVKDPKDYAWSGYGRAEAGEEESRRGILLAWGERGGITRALADHRKFLYAEGSAGRIPEGGFVGKDGKRKRRDGIPLETVKKETFSMAGDTA